MISMNNAREGCFQTSNQVSYSNSNANTAWVNMYTNCHIIIEVQMAKYKRKKEKKKERQAEKREKKVKKKSSQRKERKATQTLAVVLGEYEVTH